MQQEGLQLLCRQVAAEGAVLLKNEGNVLPLVKGDRVAVFGRCQNELFRKGAGSGGAVNTPVVSNLIDGLERYPEIELDDNLIGEYKLWVLSHPFDDGDGTWASEPFHQLEMEVPEEMAQAAAGRNNKAIVLIGRTAGEDLDNHAEPGSWFLTDIEKSVLKNVTAAFKNVIVVLNIANIMDMSWMDDPAYKDSIKAVVCMYLGGCEGGNAIADVLTGAVNPCGHLTDTIAYHIEDYPSHPDFYGVERNCYREDIYVGYRYFETFCPEKVRYPFGFGLSYTTFEQRVDGVEFQKEGNGGSFLITVSVKNTGAVAGKSSIQIYAGAPQGRLGKPVKVLADYKKTDLLAPGEEKAFTLKFPLSRLASYDDSGVTGYANAFVLEAGEYRLYVGDCCRSNNGRSMPEATVEGGPALVLNETLCLEQLEEACAPTFAFERMKPVLKDGVYCVDMEPVPLRKTDLRKRIEERLPAPFPANPAYEGKMVSFADVIAGKVSLEDFVANLTEKELAELIRAEGMASAKATPGTASAFGGLTTTLNKRLVPVACTADGPAGLRADPSIAATQLPIGTLIASTFDPDLVEEMFGLVGGELALNKVDSLLGPGMNIHRYPLNGRNFEYFSEDPVVTGYMGACAERGMKKAGVMGTLKHFCCNNQETRRYSVDSVVSQRALREIYLKGFEIAIREGGGTSVMTTYNPTNGFYNAANYDLNTTILREEWGFKGIVMTDWWANINNVYEGGIPDKHDYCSMLRSQNDMYMVVQNNGAESNVEGDNTEEGLADGRLTLGELHRSAYNIFRFILESPCSKRETRVFTIPDVEALSAEEEKAVRSGKVEYTQKNLLTGEIESMPVQNPDAPEQVGTVIDLSEERAVKGHILLEIPEDGVYAMDIAFVSDLPSAAQLLCEMQLNGNGILPIQAHGALHEPHTTRVGLLKLHKGAYLFHIRHMKVGLTFVNLVITPSDEEAETR